MILGIRGGRGVKPEMEGNGPHGSKGLDNEGNLGFLRWSRLTRIKIIMEINADDLQEVKEGEALVVGARGCEELKLGEKGALLWAHRVLEQLLTPADRGVEARWREGGYACYQRFSTQIDFDFINIYFYYIYSPKFLYGQIYWYFFLSGS